jgi:hypothetical protein
MATQTRRTTRRSARFFRGTVTASLVTACCGLVLWSAVAAYAEVPYNGLPVNGMPFNEMPFNGDRLQGLLMNGTHIHGLPAHEGFVPWGPPSERLPWSTLSQRAFGKTAAPATRADHSIPPVELLVVQ